SRDVATGQRHVRRATQPDGGVVARETFDYECLGECVRSTAAPLFRECDPQESQLAQLLDYRAGEGFLFVPPRRVGPDFALGETISVAGDLLVSLGEIEIHRGVFCCRGGTFAPTHLTMSSVHAPEVKI